MQASEAKIPLYLTVIITCYNEQKTIAECIDQVMLLKDATEQFELLIVDDHSSDNTLSIVYEKAKQYPEISIHLHAQNQGKGSAIRTALAHARGDVIAFQDADLEYDPQDYVPMLKTMHEKNADAVLGSRFLQTEGPVVFFRHRLGNQMMTLFSNLVSNMYITDIACCYKLIRRDVLARLPLREKRFAIDAEIISLLFSLKRRERQLKIYESPVQYYARTYAEGKKIRLWDVFPILWAVIRCSRLCP